MIRELRRSKRLTQEELAKEVGLSSRTIIKAEKGESVSITTMRKLEEYFNQTIFEVSDGQ